VRVHQFLASVDTLFCFHSAVRRATCTADAMLHRWCLAGSLPQVIVTSWFTAVLRGVESVLIWVNMVHNLGIGVSKRIRNKLGKRQDRVRIEVRNSDFVAIRVVC
jgi:hypothetical protein